MNTKIWVALGIVIAGAAILGFFVVNGLNQNNSQSTPTPTPSPVPTPQPVPTPEPVPVVTPDPTPQPTPPPATKPTPPPAVKPVPPPSPNPTPQPVPTPQPTPPPPAPIVQNFTVVADETVATPSSITATKGATVNLTIQVKTEGVYYGGIDYRSSVVNSGTIYAGQSKVVTFTAAESFTLTPYWPSSGVQKQSKINVVVQ